MSRYEHYSIFGESWWLDAVAGAGNWDEVRIESGGRLQARLPYVIRKKYGCTFLSMPPLTQHLGPWFVPTSAKYAKNLAQQKDLVEEMISRLPRHHVFRQNFHHAVSNWLPWFWHGFEQSSCYTYVLDDLSQEQSVLANMQSNIRGDIRKAQNRFGLTVRSDLGPGELIRICQKTFQRQERRGLPESVVRRIYEACEKRNAGQAFFAVDDKGQVHAAAYIVWDERAAYYLLGGGDPQLRNSGAHSLIMWEAILHAAKVSKSFDFEGSMIQSIERFFRAFGARQALYHQVSRTNNRVFKACQYAHKAFKALLK